METKGFALGRTVSFSWKQDGIDAVFTGEITEFYEAGPFSGFTIPAAKVTCTDGRTRSLLLASLAAVETVEPTTADPVEQALNLLQTTTAYTRTDGSARYWGFNGGGTASAAAQGYLRSLIRKNTGRVEAEVIRALFSEFDREGERITRQDVSAAIEILKSLAAV